MFQFDVLAAKKGSAGPEHEDAVPQSPPTEMPVQPGRGGAPPGVLSSVFGHLADEGTGEPEFDPEVFSQGMAAMGDFAKQGKAQRDRLLLRAMMKEWQEQSTAIQEKGLVGEDLARAMRGASSERQDAAKIADALGAEAMIRGTATQKMFFDTAMGANEAHTKARADTPTPDFGATSIYREEEEGHEDQSLDFHKAKNDPEMFMHDVELRNRIRRRFP